MTQKQILVVDDEKPLRDFVGRNLSARGFEVHTAANGLEALAIFNTHDLDLIVLDIMMPDLDGLETCRRVRQQSMVPIIILTAMGEEADRVRALDAGADDCLTKPFGVEELLARVRAALRRMDWVNSAADPLQKMQYGDLVLDANSMTVSIRNTLISLTQTEYKLLFYFMQNVGKVLPHEMILKNVWGEMYGNEAEYLRVYSGRIRRKIEPDPTNPIYLHTEYGIGYRFGG